MHSVTTSHFTSFGTAHQGSGANNEPVRPRNKRGVDENGTWDPATKRVKREDSHAQRTTNKENIIDLTQDDWEAPTRSRSPRTLLRDVTNSTSSRDRPQVGHVTTSRQVFDKVERQLWASEADFGEIRETLKKQWEADVRLQQNEVTAQLADMNQQLMNAEVSVRDVVAVMQVIRV